MLEVTKFATMNGRAANYWRKKMYERELMSTWHLKILLM